LAVQATTPTTGWVVNDAIRKAARATGTSFDYLLATAKVESNLNPNAAAKTSSARGLFQFIDQTWLSTVKQAGPALGYGRYADAITLSPSGRYEVSDPAARSAVMALRNDPAANAAMAGAFTARNAAKLTGKLGRGATDGELYIAHFLGPAGAARLIALAAERPDASAAAAFPKAAAANPSIFYNRDGSARSAAQVYGVLVGRFEVARTGAAPAAVAAAPLQPAAPMATASVDPTLFAPAADVPATAPVFHGLFRAEANRGPVSQFIRDLWTARPQVAAALSGAQRLDAVAPATPPAEGRQVGLYGSQPSHAQALFTRGG
jgi:hypothetical protein